MSIPSWNSFGPTDSWYEPDCEPDYSCYKCDEKQTVIDEAGEWLKTLVKQLYSKEKLDLLEFENNLDELCHLLNIQIGKGDLNIQRKSEFPTPLMQIANNLKILTQVN